MPRVKGQQGKVMVVGQLPEKIEYLQLKQKFYTKRIDLFLDEAYEEIDELRDEMQEAFDNTPESLQDSAVGQARSEAADQLGSIADSPPSVPDVLSELYVLHYPSLNQKSRADQADDAAVMLRDASQAAQKFLDGTVKPKKVDLKAIQEFCDQLEEHANELDNVEFPGMFG